MEQAKRSATATPPKLGVVDVTADNRRRVAHVLREAAKTTRDMKTFHSCYVILEGPDAITVVRGADGTYLDTIGKLEYLKARLFAAMLGSGSD